MTMNRNSQEWKKWVRVALGILLAVDILLVAVIWQARQAAPQALRDDRARLKNEAELLRKDVQYGEKVQRELSVADKEYKQFYGDDFLNASAGYSSLIADLGEIAGHSGVQTGGVTFKQKDLRDRGVTEIFITASVEGDYPGLVHFINGLERSRYFYLLDDLTLGSESAGSVKLNLVLRTYFRS
jgi:Tfp pilus assembly protein PilO